MVTFKDFGSKLKPNWCPACGDFSVLNAMQKAFANLQYDPSEVVVVGGIGCSGRISGYLHGFGVHGTHGRALPLAQGIKLANRDLKVVVAGGDGDAFAIGMGHTVHAIRRNIDLTYIVMDNQVYGLTKGQTSPRSGEGFKTKSTPHGAVEVALSPMETALTVGATFVAQAVSSDLKQVIRVLEAGLQHKGFSFINIFSPCVTYNKINTYQWFKKTLVSLDGDESYDPSDRMLALRRLIENQGWLTGIIYQDKERLPYEDLVAGFRKQPLAVQSADDLKLSQDEFTGLVNDFS
ncbi:2-oxoacid:ferredoxin oxidoreductase subunit beta [Pasteuria penetrans]|uniref:2-oxoacid:ferredoxin oxidoreductase subunit beta n=1 Tax=Pasteuria penetrans TaxID=86005 RepID=UPI000FAE4209|nr:2-oxoacid:ferredoxin oxidoreductase subunit beta [Pasteuria penetrans]